MTMLEQISNLPIIANSMAIWGLGQMGVGVKTTKSVLLIDLCLSDILYEQYSTIWQRAYEPPVHPEDIIQVDYYLITHEHPDHLDPLTIAPIFHKNPTMTFIASGWCRSYLVALGIPDNQILSLSAMEPTTLADSDVTVTAVPSAHYEKDYDTQKGYRWLGYMIEANGVRFYHAGDTIIYEDYIETLKKLPQIDVAILPMNGRDYFREVEGPASGNLLPVEGVRLAHDLDWDYLIVGHNDMYPFNCIPFSNIVQALETIAPRQKYKVLQPGELLYYVKS